MAQDDLNAIAQNAPLRRPGGGAGRVIGGAVLGLLAGLGLAGWFAWHSGVDLGRLATGQAPAREGADSAWGKPHDAAVPAIATVEGRVGALETRITALDGQARAAAGNAGRAEALLIAFATRRAVERGAPLGYLEDQLKVRFGDALPNVVGTVTAGARNPVTLDQLALGLDELAIQAAGSVQDSGWTKVRRQISGLFVIHNAPETTSSDPAQRVAQARLMLREGRIGEAINAVRALPLPHKDQWISAALRYQDMQRALDLLETTALVEPRELVDGAGQKVLAPVPAPAVAR